MPRDFLNLSRDWTVDAESAVSRILVPAALTAVCGGVLRYFHPNRRREQQSLAVAEGVNDIRRVIIAPEDPDKPDLRALFQDMQVQLRVQTELLDRLTERFEGHLEAAALRHAELVRLIQESKKRWM